MIWLYRVLFIPLLLLFSPYYVSRMLQRGGYRKDFRYRFGLIKGIPQRRIGVKRIWIQAVSVGELIAIEPLLALFNEDDRFEVILTTTTSTGYSLARNRYHTITTAIGLFPLDFWLFSTFAWRRIQPDLVVLIEGERWPEHIYQASKRSIPIALINARISDRSFSRYRLFSFLSTLLIKPIDLILASTKQDYERLIVLGANVEKLILSGNLKLDIEIEPQLNRKQVDTLITEIGFKPNKNKPGNKMLILLGSSTWANEEKAILLAFKDALSAGIDCRLLIVPRHAERHKEIKNLLESQSLPFHFRSISKQPPEPVMISVADTTGELKMLTQIADLVFIGKSLPPSEGGQTPVEAAALGKPLIFGPRTSNFKQICEALVKIGAAKRINNVSELSKSTVELFQSEGRRLTMSIAATKWHQENRGATKQTLEEIKKLIKVNN